MHIPPLNGRASINYKNKNYTIGLYTIYNHWKFAEDFDAGGIDNLDEATIDGVPSWYTLNIGYTQNITENTTFIMNIKNLTDVHYKTFGSGISASGINFVIGLNTSF